MNKNRVGQIFLKGLPLFFFLCGFTANAQQKIEVVPITEIQEMWLYNSKGIVVASLDSIADRSFFDANEVFIQTKAPSYKKEDKYAVIVSPSSGDAKAFFLSMPLLSLEVKDAILKDTGQTKVTVTKNAGNGQYRAFTLIVR